MLLITAFLTLNLSIPFLSSGDDALAVDTLIAETNAGSLRWMYSLDEMPIPYRSFERGDLKEHILPDEGFTSKEAEKMEKEKTEMEAKVIVKVDALTPEEFEQKAAEVLESAQEEYEETKRILNAPPGSDFVPGLDDVVQSDNADAVSIFDDEKEEIQATAAEIFDLYIDATEEEYQEASKDIVKGP
jgi:hypothetical protein